MSVPSDPSADPGWGGGFSGFAWVPVPGLSARRRQHPDGLVALRLRFMNFAVVRGCIGLAVVGVAAGWRLEPSTLATAIVALGVGAVGVAERIASRLLARPLDPSSPDTLATSYRSRFLLRLAFADASALVGFAGFVLTANSALHALGVAFAVVRFARLAPSARNLAQDQAELQLAGCSHSLVAALRKAPSPRAGMSRRTADPPLQGSRELATFAGALRLQTSPIRGEGGCDSGAAAGR